MTGIDDHSRYGGQRVIAEFGIALAAAVLLDAFIVRMVLVAGRDAPVWPGELVAARLAGAG